MFFSGNSLASDTGKFVNFSDFIQVCIIRSKKGVQESYVMKDMCAILRRGRDRFSACHLFPVSENKKTFFSALLITVLLVAGCSAIGQQLIDKPEIEYLGMNLKDLSLFEATPVFRFRFTNTNPMGMDVSSVSYNLKINNRKFVKGVSGRNVRIMAVSSGEMELPVSFSFSDLFPSPASAEEGISYELSGMIRIGPYSLPYEAVGRFDLPKIPGISLKEVRISDLSESSASLMLVLDLSNPNAFPLDVDTIAYVFRVNGADMGQGAVSLPEAVAEKTQVRISVPVNTVCSGQDALLCQMLKSAAASCEISGVMKFRTFKSGLRGISFQDRGEKIFVRQ